MLACLNISSYFAIMFKNTGEACEHSYIPLKIDCGKGVIQIEHAVYGVHSNDNSCGSTYEGECAADTSLQASFSIISFINMTLLGKLKLIQGNHALDPVLLIRRKSLR